MTDALLSSAPGDPSNPLTSITFMTPDDEAPDDKDRLQPFAMSQPATHAANPFNQLALWREARHDLLANDGARLVAYADAADVVYRATLGIFESIEAVFVHTLEKIHEELVSGCHGAEFVNDHLRVGTPCGITFATVAKPVLDGAKFASALRSQSNRSWHALVVPDPATHAKWAAHALTGHKRNALEYARNTIATHGRQWAADQAAEHATPGAIDAAIASATATGEPA